MVETTPSIPNLAGVDVDADDEAEDNVEKLPTQIISVSDDDAAVPPEFSQDSTRGGVKRQAGGWRGQFGNSRGITNFHT